jgi:predicted Holliday junction resolvase-like endonuclease
MNNSIWGCLWLSKAFFVLLCIVIALLLSYHLTARLHSLEGQVEALQSRLEAVEVEREPMFQRWRDIEQTYREWYSQEIEEGMGNVEAIKGSSHIR